MNARNLAQQKALPFPDHCIDDRIEVIKMMGCRHSKTTGILLAIDWRNLKEKITENRITGSDYRIQMNSLKKRVKDAFDYYKR